MKKKHPRPISKFRMKLEALFKIVFGKIFAYEKMLVFEIQNMPLSRIRENEAKVNIRLAQSSDVLNLANEFKRFKGGKIEERLKKGHLCFVAEKNGDIVHYTWFAFNEVYVNELERKMLIGPDYAYLYDAYTVPECRGMGINFKGLCTYFDYLFESGIKKTFYLISPNNFPSLRSAEKVGSRHLGEVTLIRLFKSRRYKCRGKTPRDYAMLREMFSI